MRETSTVDINNYFKNYKGYGGCMSQDQLPMNKAKQHKFYVINLDKSSGAGTHWVSLWSVNPRYVLYVDSFGLGPPTKIEKFMKKTGKKMLWSDSDLQNSNSNSCGEFCMMILTKLAKGISPLDILYNDFTPNTNKNEHNLKHFFNI